MSEFIKIFFNDIGESFPEKQPLLAHYTDLQTAEKILKGSEIWFSNPSLMNDLDEMRFGVLEGMRILRNNTQIKEAFKNQRKYEFFSDKLEECYKKFEEYETFDTYVFCFSEHQKDDYDGKLSMWRGYGDNGNGAAIVFDTSKIEAIEQSPLIIAKVEYASNETRLNWLEQKVEQLISYIEHIKSDEDIIDICFGIFERIKLFALCSKHIAFSEENEWRIIYFKERDLENSLVEMLDYSNNQNGISPKLKLPIEPIENVIGNEVSLLNITNRIILGPTDASVLKEKSFKRMLRKIDLNELVNITHASKIPYRK